MKKTGLILSGGGARAAYQVGVLKAINTILPKGHINPFDIISGTSAGAINGVALASYADTYRMGIKRLERVWSHFDCEQIYRCDTTGASKMFAKMLRTLLIGRSYKHDIASALDNGPLRELLKEMIHFDNLQNVIDKGALHALVVNCSSLTTGESVSFFQGHYSLKNWQRQRRIGTRARITLEHLMASSAIPMIFPAVKLQQDYYVDGAVRQLSPISPALHLGAEKIMVIGVSEEEDATQTREHDERYPTPAKVLGHVLNAAFLDSMETDLERLVRINETVSKIPEKQRAELDLRLKPVDLLMIRPSQSLDQIAGEHADEIPGVLKLFLGGSGNTSKSGAGVLSYLLFSKGYCNALIDLGYRDALTRRDEISAFFADHLSTQQT